MVRPVRIISIVSLGILAVAGVFAILHPAAVQAISLEDVGQTLNLGSADLKTTIINVIKVALGLVGLVAVSYLIYGGYLWLTAGGNEARVEKAKQTILQAIIGLVIILLAWAIVLFVSRTTTNLTGNGGPGTRTFCQLNPFDPICIDDPTSQKFNVTAITTCAQRPDYDTSVPLASAVAITFNTSLKIPANATASNPISTDTVKTAVEDTDANVPNLEIKKCMDSTCRNFVAEPAAWPPDAYGKIRPAAYSGLQPTAPAAGNTKAEWVAKKNTVTFYHKSFSTDPANADNRFFESNTTYRVFIPKKGSTTAITDIRNRALELCQRGTGTPLEGETIIGENCKVDDIGGVIYWTFTTGTDIEGPAINVASTIPTSKYLTGTGTPNRNVNLRPTIAVDFTGGIDPNSLDVGNFTVTKFSVPPNLTTGQGGTLDPDNNNPVPLPSSDFAYFPNATGTGGSIKSSKDLEAFTWYKVEVKDVSNLCGTLQKANPYSWVFETNDTAPGVKQVYPANNFAFACPSTEVFIQYNTSMWDPASGGTDCAVGINTYVTDGNMSPNPGRTLRVVDPYNAADPDSSCTIYAFKPESVGLQPGQLYHLGVNSDMVIDISGTKLNAGDIPPANSPSVRPWSFTVTTPEKCVQPPYITSISPGQGTNGQCISVYGGHFDPQSNDLQEAGDLITFETINQGRVDPGAWTNSSIVSTIDAGSPIPDTSYPYHVTVNYPAPIGPIQDNSGVTWRLNSGSPSLGPCLTAISPKSGPIGTQVTATGKRFGPGGGQSKVTFSLPPAHLWDISSANWTDTRIAPVVVSTGSTEGPPAGDVQVYDNLDQASNALKFTVTPQVVPPGAPPKVEETTACIKPPDPAAIVPSPNPRKNETQACINASPSARFVSDMNTSTLTTGNIILEKCADDYSTCDVPAVSTTIVPTIRAFQLNPTANLAPSTSYRVTIGTGVTTASPKNVPFAAPYVWKFKTKAGTTPCPIDNVTLPSCGVTYSATFAHDLPAQVSDTACNTVNGNNLTYAWTNSQPLVCTLLKDAAGNDITGPTNLCSGPTDPLINDFTSVTVKTEGKTSTACKISFDSTFCADDSQCQQNKFGELCGAAGTSKCVNNSCTPVVNGFDPASGKIGTWVTVKGCWFGSYLSGTSKVLFKDNKEGLAPNTLICGSASGTWTNERIVREVPDVTTPTDNSDDAVDGPVQVVRRDTKTSTSSSDYIVDPALDHPKLCKLVPNKGRPSTIVDVSGQDFGLTRDTITKDNVRFTRGAVSLDATIGAAFWGDKLIKAEVPDPAPTFGIHDVVVLNNDVPSNSLPFDILDPAAVGGACTDGVCSFAAGGPCKADYACGYSNCCVPEPKIVPPTNPPQGAQNVCRNTLAQVTFDRPVNVQSGAVTYTDNGTAVSGRASVSGAVVSYAPGLLSVNGQQKLTLTANLIRSPAGAAANVIMTPSCVGSPDGTLCFTSGPDICTLNQVVVTANGQQSHTFFKINDLFFPYVATAYANNGNALAQVSGVYTWDWSWLVVDPNLALVSNGNRNADIGQETVTSKITSGKTSAEATAQVTTNQAKPLDKPKRSGRAGVVVDICENPATYGDSAYDLVLSYCRGNGTTNLLPDFFAYTATDTSTDPAPLKSYFFKESATSRDAIGMLIFDNRDFLSPFDWYSRRFPLDTGGSSTTVGGYPALRTGTTTYVGVAKSSSGGLSGGGIMVVLDYNSNSALASTKSVYSQLISKIQFNSSMDSVSVAQVIRDTKRKQDVAGIALLAESYKKKNGSYPNLAAGSFIIGMSTSAWPSWQNALGNTVGRALPQDPLNDLTPACVAPYEKSTCWAETTKTFTCPTDSHIYLYTSTGAGYSIFGRMEYAGGGTFANAPPGTLYNPCAANSSSVCSCFNYELTTDAGGPQLPPVL